MTKPVVVKMSFAKLSKGGTPIFAVDRNQPIPDYNKFYLPDFDVKKPVKITITQ